MAKADESDPKYSTSRPMCVWLTGPPASGKTTIAGLAAARLPGAVVLDSDKARQILTPNATYSDAERELVYRAIAWCARTLVEAGHDVLVAATANRRQHRDTARAIIGRFAEVYVRCGLSESEKRDPKGLYKAARAGTITTLPILMADQAPEQIADRYPTFDIYEPPTEPALVLDTERVSVSTSVEALISFINERRHLPFT